MVQKRIDGMLDGAIATPKTLDCHELMKTVTIHIATSDLVSIKFLLIKATRLTCKTVL